jgi:hypothetical protein
MDQIIADCEKHGLLIAVYQGKGQVIPLCTVAKTGRIVKAIKIPDRTMTEIMRASAQQILDACNEKLGGTTNTKEKNCYGK